MNTNVSIHATGYDVKVDAELFTSNEVLVKFNLQYVFMGIEQARTLHEKLGQVLLDYEVTQLPQDDRFETCEDCGEQLDKSKGEDFFVEDERGGHVFCASHWQRYDAIQNERYNHQNQEAVK